MTHSHDPANEELPVSMPPEAKVATAKGNAMAHVIAQLTEVVALILASGLLWNGSITENTWLMITGGTLVGPAVGKATGKVPMASTVTLLALLPVVKKGALAKLLATLAILLASGCSPAMQKALVPVATQVLTMGGEALLEHARGQGVELAEDTLVCVVADEDTLESMAPEGDLPDVGLVCMGWVPQ